MIGLIGLLMLSFCYKWYCYKVSELAVNVWSLSLFYTSHLKLEFRVRHGQIRGQYGSSSNGCLRIIVRSLKFNISINLSFWANCLFIMHVNRVWMSLFWHLKFLLFSIFTLSVKGEGSHVHAVKCVLLSFAHSSFFDPIFTIVPLHSHHYKLLLCRVFERV